MCLKWRSPFARGALRRWLCRHVPPRRGHATIPFPESLIALGPEPLEEGIFLYCARRFRDRFGWDDVEETRRKNCRSGPPVQGAQVTHTEATMERSEGDLFCRRNHHRGDNQFCVVHYLIRPQKTTVAPTRMRMEALSRRLWMEAKKIPRVPPTPMMSMETPIMIRTLMKAKRANLYLNLGSSDVHLEQLDHSIHSLGYLEALARGLVSKGNASGVILLIDEKHVFKMARRAEPCASRNMALALKNILVTFCFVLEKKRRKHLCND
ncbi:hypothetical protein F2Q70_00006091 [Brassica cretica]|uniref:Uncharacterized protein n=1 Tax=Brassica cretica TaxID=69181 RepID=A0A8S9IPY2_BRACR|nr:hypothetical protein F2Q70_00006091 [Brassica cretica]